MTDAIEPAQFCKPAILLAGMIDHGLYASFRTQLDEAPAEGLIVVELSTLGGDPDVARMMGEDIRYRSQFQPHRHFIFLGKAVVYSAGVTFMSFFARDNRYLLRGTRLMVHERQMSDTVRIEGPLTSCVAGLRAKLHEVEHSILIQNQGFESLIEGSQVSIDEVLRRAPDNWYIDAREAHDLGLIRAVI